MSPSRAGRHSSSSNTSHCSSTAARTAATTSVASRSRIASASGSSSCGMLPSIVTAGPFGAAARVASSAWYSGCEPGWAWISSRKTWFTQSSTGRGRAEVAREQLGRGDERVARLEERRDVGPAEPVDRLLRVADEEEVPGLDRDLGPRARRRVSPGSRRRASDTAMSTWIGSVSWNSSMSRRWYRRPSRARAAGPCSGWRSSRRASTSRSWNSSSPATRRASTSRAGELGDGDRERADDRAGDLAAASVPVPSARRRMRSRSSVDVAPPRSLAADVRCTLNDGCGRRNSSSRSAVSRASRSLAAYASNSSRRASSLSSASTHWSRSAQTASSAAIHCSISSSGIGGGGGHLVEQVPVGGERLGDRTQLLELHARREAEHDHRLMFGFVDEPVHEPFPARVERDTGRDLVADLDARREPGLDRELGEEPLRERVQGADRGAVEVVERSCARRVGRARCCSSSARTRYRNSAAAFSVNVIAAMLRIGMPDRTSADDAADQRRGLAGARTRFDEQRARRARCGSPRARRRRRPVA